MKTLFVHQSFPGQFKFLAPALAQEGHEVVAMAIPAGPSPTLQGVRLAQYRPQRGSTPDLHPWLTDFEAKAIRGEACFRAASRMKQQEGYTPDVIVAHPGWGESLFLKEVWPQARMGLYCEFFYRYQGTDVGFDPEFPTPDAEGDACRLRLKNLNNLLHFEVADAGISPTEWQASTFPEPFRQRIRVVHDGIDTEALRPNPGVRVTVGQRQGGTVSLGRDDEVITFVNRNLEPYRGYHVFMRALPELLRRRPRARVMIVGGNEVSYGAKPDPARYGNKPWRDIYIDEVRPQLTDEQWARVHFLGKIPYPNFIALLQLSTVHVYLTYPFVLSWSLLEAMSLGCAIVASDTQPLREAIHHGKTGQLVDFFDRAGLVEQVCGLLDDPNERQRLGRAAREFAQARYDLRRICLPQQLAWVESLADR